MGTELSALVTSTTNVTINWDSTSNKNQLSIIGSLDGLVISRATSAICVKNTDGSYGILIVIETSSTGTPKAVTATIATPDPVLFPSKTTYTFVEFQLGNPPTRKPNPRVIVRDIIPF